jgi:hypothetical protein
MAAPPRQVPELPTPAQVANFAATLEGLLEVVLASPASEHIISHQRVKETAFHFLRDLYHTNDYPDRSQNDGMSITKIAGHLTYWIAKIKPIAIAYETTHEKYADNKEITEVSGINEQVALELGLFLLETSERQGDDGLFSDHIRSQCTKMSSCDGVQCITHYARSYFAFHDRYFEKYLKNAMRVDLVSAHDLTVLYDQIIFSACRPDLK